MLQLTPVQSSSTIKLVTEVRLENDIKQDIYSTDIMIIAFENKI